MKRYLLALSTVLLSATCVAGGSKAGALDGKALYIEKCAMCHDAMGMGTGLLQRRVQPAELEKRDNLIPAYVVMFARNGIGNMPPIPRGEVSDPQLQAIADYLANSNQ